MLKDITLGQYFPADSIVHRMDPRTKIIVTVLYVAVVFMAKNAFALALPVLFLFTAAALSQIPPRLLLKSVKGIIPIIVLTGLLNMFYVRGETVYWSWWVFSFSKEGIFNALFIVSRILIMIAGSSMLTYTTTPTTLTDGIERLMMPLKLFRINVHDLAMVMTIALRMVPTLIEETDRIISAQKARGADMESGGPIKRLRAMLPVFLPLLISAFLRARDLAIAMECRCYTGVNRTRMKVLRMARRDYLAFGVFLLLLAGVLLLNIPFKAVLL